MGTETNKDDRNTPEYLAQLLKDKKQLQALPNIFIHTEKILDEEINRVRLGLFHCQAKREILDLPEPLGPVVQLQEKLFVPVKEYPDFNFVGRILGPRGMTAKELEQFTGCKIMVRGKGSMREKSKEEQNRGKANWEHLNEELHVLITVEDTRNRGEIKIARAKEEVKKLLVPAPEGEDDLKKRQLMELAIINGTYRDTTKPSPSPPSQTSLPGQQPRFLAQPLGVHMPRPAQPFILAAPRLPPPTVVASSHQTSLNGSAPPPLVSPPHEATGLMYNPYAAVGSMSSAAIASPVDPYGLGATTPSIFEYQAHLDQAQAGGVPKIRRTLEGVRGHPYTRVSLS